MAANRLWRTRPTTELCRLAPPPPLVPARLLKPLCWLMHAYCWLTMRFFGVEKFISQEILSRQDPRLVDAWEVCELYRVEGPHDQHDVRSTFEPQFVRDCVNIDRRYGAATSAIRRDLEARIATEDLATVAQAGTGRP